MERPGASRELAVKLPIQSVGTQQTAVMLVTRMVGMQDMGAIHTVAMPAIFAPT